jgi:drug/metabolite transporter (DMT)-like permease
VTRRGALLVACAAMCWSSGGLITRLVSTSPWTTSLWRSLFAALFLAMVLSMVRGRGFFAQWREVGRPVLAVATCMALSSTCFILSLAHTSVANTLILMSTGPYVAGLLGWILLGERVAPRTWLTMGVALAGAVVMVGNSYSRGALLGNLLAIVMAGSFAIATVLIRRHPEIQMAPAAVLATALTALVALPLADPLETTPSWPRSRRTPSSTSSRPAGSASRVSDHGGSTDGLPQPWHRVAQDIVSRRPRAAWRSVVAKPSVNDP